MSHNSGQSSEPDPSGWAVGFSVFAGTMLFIVGLFQFFEGVVAAFNDEFFVVTTNYTFNIDTTTYGWTHMIIGAIVALVGLAILGGQTWGRVVGIAIAIVSMIANFLFIPYYPWWSLLIIALNVMIIWALAQNTRRS